MAQSTVRLKTRLVIVVHPEDEAAVDHDAEVVQTPGDGGVVAPEVLALVALDEIARGKRLEADEQAAQVQRLAARSTTSPRRIESTVAAP